MLSMSPVKTSSKFFDGEHTDGNKSHPFCWIRQNSAKKYQNQGIPVTLNNCQIALNKFHKKLEVVIKPYTTMEELKIDFKIEIMKTIGSDMIKLKDLGTKKKEYDRITTRATVLKMTEPMSVGKELIKQEVTIADDTEAALITLWEDNINTLITGQSYQFNRVVVRTYRGNFQLSLQQTGASVEPIDDLDSVKEDSFELDHDILLEGAEVMGVTDLGPIYSCVYCKRGMVKVSPENSTIGTCEQCNTCQRLQREKVTCKLFLDAGEEHVTLRGYEDMLKAIIQDEVDAISCENLLSAAPFDVKYNDYHVITGISRKQ